MPTPLNDSLLEVILDSWDRNNRILVNLLRALPPGGLEARAMPDSHSVAEMFTHIRHVRLIFISEDAPDMGIEAPPREWAGESDPEVIAEQLNRSAEAVRNTVERHPLGPRDGSSLRPSAAVFAAHDLARGLPSWPDQADAEAGGLPARRQRDWTS